MSQFQVPYATDEKPFLLEYYSKGNLSQSSLATLQWGLIVQNHDTCQDLSLSLLMEMAYPDWLGQILIYHLLKLEVQLELLNP